MEIQLDGGATCRKITSGRRLTYRVQYRRPRADDKREFTVRVSPAVGEVLGLEVLRAGWRRVRGRTTAHIMWRWDRVVVVSSNNKVLYQHVPEAELVDPASEVRLSQWSPVVAVDPAVIADAIYNVRHAAQAASAWALGAACVRSSMDPEYEVCMILGSDPRGRVAVWRVTGLNRCGNNLLEVIHAATDPGWYAGRSGLASFAAASLQVDQKTCAILLPTIDAIRDRIVSPAAHLMALAAIRVAHATLWDEPADPRDLLLANWPLHLHRDPPVRLPLTAHLQRASVEALEAASLLAEVNRRAACDLLAAATDSSAAEEDVDLWAGWVRVPGTRLGTLAAA